MKDSLPKKPNKTECIVLNHDSSSGNGTHWTCYIKRNQHVLYFDSFGHLPPPKALTDYLGGDVKIHYNYQNCQDYSQVICGQLCLIFMYEFWKERGKI